MKLLLAMLLITVVIPPKLVSAQTWEPQMAVAPPDPRIGHSMANDTAHQVVMMFGGTSFATSQIFNDTWTWDGSSWTLQSPLVTPNARSFAAIAFDSGRSEAVMFGGQGSPGPFPDSKPKTTTTPGNQASTGPLLGDTWTWDGTNWNPKAPRRAPSPRIMHAMAYDPVRKQTVLFGGYDGTTQTGLNDTWLWNGKNWTLASPTNIPRPSTSALMSYDAINQAILLYDEFFRETWLWDGSNWQKQSPLVVPPARLASSLAQFPANNRLILFGGTDPSSGIQLGDTWLWDGTTWSNNPLVSDLSARTGSVLSAGPSASVTLFGGQNGIPSSPLNETWAFVQLPFLAFPLANTDAFSVAINTVMDHDMDIEKATSIVQFYGVNGSVVDYVGDQGALNCGLSECVQAAPGPKGYKNTSGTSFATNLGNYTGGGGCIDLSGNSVPCDSWLFYEGHPGYDFKADLGSFIFAPANGIAFIPDCDPIQRLKDCEGPTPGTAVDGFNILAIDHGNGYSSWYLHLGDLVLAEKEPATIPPSPSQIAVVHSGQGVFQENVKVVLVGAGVKLTQVTSAPGPGQYSVDPIGIYTFNAADSGSQVRITYYYQAADFRTIQCPGQPPISLRRGDGLRVPVTPACIIAQTGNKAINKSNDPEILGPHLHFEVRKGLKLLPDGTYQCLRPACMPVDPYGWQGVNNDPYPGGPNIMLWQIIFEF